MISTLIEEPARIASLRETPDGLRRLRAEAPGLVSRCREYPALLRGHWDAIRKMADESVWPVDRLEPYFSFVLSMADIYLDSVEALRQGIDEAGDGVIDGSALSEVADSVRSLRAEASAVWSFLTAPPARRTLRTTAEIREGRARGEYVSLDETVAQATGDASEVS
jgi:hypothetical protein